MNFWTVIMLLEGGKGADVTLFIAVVTAQTMEEAALAAWDQVAGDEPAVVDLIVQEGRHPDVGGRGGALRAMLNA